MGVDISVELRIMVQPGKIRLARSLRRDRDGLRIIKVGVNPDVVPLRPSVGEVDELMMKVFGVAIATVVERENLDPFIGT